MGSLAPQSRIAQLSAKISKHTEIVDAYLSKNNLPQPSFDPSDQIAPGFASWPPEVIASRLEVLEATAELRELLTGPFITLSATEHVQRILHLQFISRYQIAAKVPLEGSISYEELAELTGVQTSLVRRILRHAIVWRMFQEKERGQISHSLASKVLVVNPKADDWLREGMQSIVPGLMHGVDALQQWPEAAEPSQTGAMLAYPESKGLGSFYEYVDQDPEHARRFANMMSFMHQQNPQSSLKHVANGYAWDQHKLVVDVGGSQGDTAFTIAEKFPTVQIIVQDLAKVVEQAKERPEHAVSFMSHDFFDPQPVPNADVYFFRWILHNWSDKYATKILQALIPALKPDARVLVMDTITPKVGSIPNGIERQSRGFDMTMLAMYNARARELDEWQDLFSQADKRFEFVGVTKPPGSQLSFIEVKWTP